MENRVQKTATELSPFNMIYPGVDQIGAIMVENGAWWCPSNASIGAMSGNLRTTLESGGIDCFDY
jgi:hypothetical protein